MIDAQPGRLAVYRKAVAAAAATVLGIAAQVAVTALPVLHGRAQAVAQAIVALATAVGVPVAVASAPRNAAPHTSDFERLLTVARQAFAGGGEVMITTHHPDSLAVQGAYARDEGPPGS